MSEFENFLDDNITYHDSKRDAAEKAWDYQQVKIDALKKELLKYQNVSIIDMLGGYESAFSFAASEQAEGYDMSALKKELLEHRRKNDMIAIGDYVIIDNHKDPIYQITVDDIDSHWIHLVTMRHATDEEIELLSPL